MREWQHRRKSYGFNTLASRACRNQLETCIQISSLHPPWYLNFHTQHEAAICNIYTPCKEMTIDDDIA